jgi:hypothetical protein
LARFRSEIKSEYFVIVEDQVGKIVESGRKQTWSWGDLIGKNIIDPTDVFYISHGGVKLFSQPDTKYLETTTKRILFDEASAAKILEKEAEIKNNAKGYDLK